MLQQIPLPVSAERRVVEAGLVAIRTAGEVVVLAEEAERAMAGALRVALATANPGWVPYSLPSPELPARPTAGTASMQADTAVTTSFLT